MKPSEMTDQELIEAWFVEVHGWQDTGQVLRRGNPIAYCSQPKIFKQPDGQEVFLGIRHNILDSESAFNEHVLPVMEERGLLLRIEEAWAHWVDAPPFSQATVTITKNRRLRAAVEGALEIWREKHDL